MSEAVQYLTYLNPMHYVLVIVRGTFLQALDIALLDPASRQVAERPDHRREYQHDTP